MGVCMGRFVYAVYNTNDTDRREEPQARGSHVNTATMKKRTMKVSAYILKKKKCFGRT